MDLQESLEISFWIINLLLTEREGRTGECWPEVVAKRGPHRNDRGPILGTLSTEDGECHGRSIDGKRGSLGTAFSPPEFVT